MTEGLTPDQVAAFERDGYLIIPDALPPAAVDALLAETRRLLEEDFTLEGHPLTKFQTGSGEDGDGAHVGDEYFLGSGNQVRFFLEEDAFDAATGQLAKPKERAVNKIGHYLHVLNPVFSGITSPTPTPTQQQHLFAGAVPVAPIARSLGFRDARCLQSMIICKQPEIGGAVPPHQDSTFLYTDPPSAVGFWYALEDATVDNGCLSFWPGSHKTAPVRNRLVRKAGGGTHMVPNAGPQFPAGQPDPNSDSIIAAADENDASKYVMGEVKAGSLVLIHGNLLHKSEKNRSSKGRIIYTFHVIEGEGTVYDEKNWLQPPEEGFTRLFA